MSNKCLLNEWKGQSESCDRDSEDPNCSEKFRKVLEERTPELNLQSHSVLMGVLLQFFPLHKSENQGSVMFSNSPKAGTEDREAWCGGISGGQSGDRNRTRYFDAQDGWPGIRLSPGQ